MPPGTDVVVPPPAAEVKPAAGPTTGRVIVKSTPTGATVSLDGKVRGHTPVTIRELTFGTHALVVSRAGFATDTRDFSVSADRPAGDVLVELKAARAPVAPPKPALKTGSLDVNTRPAGATVFLDGKPIGVTPISVPEVKVGSHAIHVELLGYKSISATIDVAAGQTARFTVTLEHTTGATPGPTTRRD